MIGEWFAWDEICGEHHEVIFGDGKGVFGHETAESHLTPVYNKFGNLVAGHEKVEQKDRGGQ